jgi:hypothetical protein
MLWTARHHWPKGTQFVFNCYRHYARCLIRSPGGKPSIVLPMEITVMDTEDEYKKYGTLRLLRYMYSNPLRFPISSLGLPNFPSQKSCKGVLAKYTTGT